MGGSGPGRLRLRLLGEPLDVQLGESFNRGGPCGSTAGGGGARRRCRRAQHGERGLRQQRRGLWLRKWKLRRQWRGRVRQRHGRGLQRQRCHQGLLRERSRRQRLTCIRSSSCGTGVRERRACKEVAGARGGGGRGRRGGAATSARSAPCRARGRAARAESSAVSRGSLYGYLDGSPFRCERFSIEFMGGLCGCPVSAARSVAA